MATEHSTIPVESRDIPGCLGYRADIDGEIWSCQGFGTSGLQATWHKLKPSKGKNGYLSVQIFMPDKSSIRYYVHRLVLITFVGPCPDGMECLHGPGGKTDNSLANIRWGTPIENAADKIRDGTSTQGVRNPSARFDDDIIRSIRRERALGSTTISLAKKYNYIKDCEL
jgi:hypothetical protein